MRARRSAAVAATAFALILGAGCASSSTSSSSTSSGSTTASLVPAGSPTTVPTGDGGSSPSTVAATGGATTTAGGSSTASAACTLLDGTTAGAYTGFTPTASEYSLTAKPTSATTCTYSSSAGVALTLTVTDGTAAFDAAPGPSSSAALVDGLKWDDSSMTVAAEAQGKSFVGVYGPASAHVTVGLATNLVQFLAQGVKEGKI